jgi:uncharacterized protein YndB with AHSA1/START domain
MNARSASDAPVGDTKVELVGDREIVISRTFRAPARLVFDAWTKAELVRRWWVPKSRAQVVDITADVRIGGTYRYVFSAHGIEYAFSGKYLEIDAPHRLVYSQIFESYPDAPLTITVTFEEHDGRTRLTSRETYPSKETREAALASGMEPGMREAMDQLDELVTARA